MTLAVPTRLDTPDRLAIIAFNTITSDPFNSLEDVLVRERPSRLQSLLQDQTPETLLMFQQFQAEQIESNYYRLTAKLNIDPDNSLLNNFCKLQDYNKITENIILSTKEHFIAHIREEFAKWIRKTSTHKEDIGEILVLIDFILQAFSDVTNAPTNSGIISHLPQATRTSSYTVEDLSESISTELDDISDTLLHMEPLQKSHILKKAVTAIKHSYLQILDILTQPCIPLLLFFLEALENEPSAIIHNDIMAIVRTIRTNVHAATQSLDEDDHNHQSLQRLKQQITSMRITLISILSTS